MIVYLLSPFHVLGQRVLGMEASSRRVRDVHVLAAEPPEGVKYLPNEDDSIAEVICDIDGPVGTPYENGIFRVRVVLGDYPLSAPKAWFVTKVFHSNVSSTGEICVNTLKRDWDSSVTLDHIFKVIRCLLIVQYPESSLNDEAGKLFLESYDEFCRRAELMTSLHAMPKKYPGSSPGTCNLGPGTVTSSSGSSSTDMNISSVSFSDANASGLEVVPPKAGAVNPRKAKVTPMSAKPAGHYSWKGVKAVDKASSGAKDARKKGLKRL
ncbi:unnamed protein product [Discosporangium mesarthrocarpum]